MANTDQIYGQVKTPRIYIDFPSYAIAMDYVRAYGFYNVNAINSTDIKSVWGLNPYYLKTFSVGSSNSIAFRIYFKNYYEQTASEDHSYNSNEQWANLIDTTNYFGILGHDGANITDAHSWRIRSKNNYEGNHYSETVHPSGTEGIVGESWEIGKELGYSLYKIKDSDKFSSGNAGEIEFELVPFPDHNLTQWDYFKIGSFTFGKYLDFPVSPDLNVSMTCDYSGIKSQKTVSGDELTQINYIGSPNWGEFAPWTHINVREYSFYSEWFGLTFFDTERAMQTEDFRGVKRQGRRSFKVKFSYVDKNDMFPKDFEGTLAGNYGSFAEELGDNIILNGTMAETGGIEGTTSGSSNVALNWRSSYTTNVTSSIVTGNGFNGNAQKVITTADDTTFHLKYHAASEMAEDTQYKVTFNYRSNSDPSSADIRVRVGYGNFSNDDGIYLPTNTGNAARATYYFTPTSQTNVSTFPTYISFYAYQRDSGTYLEVSDIEVREVITPAGTWFDNNEGTHTDNIIGNFLNYTLGGQIPFIFQPDNTKKDFAICRLDKASSTIEQVAHGVYSVSMTFVETW